MCKKQTLISSKDDNGNWEIKPQSVYDHMRDHISTQSTFGTFIAPDEDLRPISFITEDPVLGPILKQPDKPYFASRFGRIFSVIDGRLHELTPYSNRPGKQKEPSYLQVQIMIDGKRHPFLLHRLIASAFCPNCRKAPEVHHMGAKSDNSADALLFCFPKEHKKLDYLKRNGPYDEYISYADEVRQFNGQSVKLPLVKLMYPYEKSNNIIEYGIAVPVQAAIALSQGKTWDEVIKLPNPEDEVEPMTPEEKQDYLRKHPITHSTENADVEYAFVLRRCKDTTEAKKENA
jgi:hypothetical protein